MKELELEVYVRSYALGKTGIQWRKIENGESILGYPHILEQTIIPKNTGGLGTIEYKINYQKLSFVLVRHSQQLLLLVAGIEAPEKRSNQLGSTIFNAVAWVANPDESNSIPSENELTLRHLAARALLSFVGKDPEFINTINEAIDFKGLEEFKVKGDEIDQLTKIPADKLEQLLLNLDKPEGDQQNWYKKDEKIGNEQEIISLAEKIIKTELPKDGNLAILISKVDENTVSVSPIDIKTETSTDNQDQEVTASPENIFKNIEAVKDNVGKPKMKKQKFLLLIILVITLVLMLLLSLKMMKNQKEEEPQKIKIPQTLVSPKPEYPVSIINKTNN
ncbi:hypothetical protein L2E71_14625 [Planktothrix agardhii 1032]|jgi:hypothetical protein|uniref:hypothetical protein n=1 Tax=Planktothrix agardhii TaxID=1160 RepID=UPI001D0A6316|nr:hypothetical protein [Planktothrix agardhii]MCB8777191.1 hypothetical protein [Planktothrix agardhii 1031]MCF3599304.1 hypothetical protein [Planktothrix agardhii 1032]